MLNRFKTALYGPSGSNEDSVDGLNNGDYKNATTIGGKIRGALTRSSSFREDLLSEMCRDRALSGCDLSERDNVNNNKNGSTNTISNGRATTGSLQRGQSQTARRPTTTTTTSAGKDETTARQQARKGTSKSAAGTGGSKVPKYRYTRPEFLQLRTDDEIIVSADHHIRPIILPRDVSRLPWKSGYAECINAGKSARNEDQAACYQDVAIRQSSLLNDSISTSIEDQIPWTYFGLFDGHAGTAVAIAAAAQLHNIISEKLRQVAHLLIALEFDDHMTEDEPDDEYTDCASSPKTFSGASSKCSKLEERSSPDKPLETKPAEREQIEEETTDEQQPPQKQREKQEKAGDERERSTDAEKRPTENNGDNSFSCDTDQKAARSTITTASPTETRQQQRARRRSTSDELSLMAEFFRPGIEPETLIIGALELAFCEMDAIIASDKHDYKMDGGCTAIVSVFILGKLYVCNAGDSRAIVYMNDKVKPMSFDFTPRSERKRILRLGSQRPEFMGNEFTHLEFLRRPGRKDLGKQMLYKDAHMTGWSMKTITYDDLKIPLVWGEGKRSRLLATIGVTRGFGDHELRSHFGSLLIKPFLTPEPEVRVVPLDESVELTTEDVLIMGSDGLWDVISNEEAARVVKRSFDLFPDNEESRSKYRYITAAQDLILHSRGHTSNWNNVWRMSDDGLASLDDISAFVVPLKAYQDEYLEWKRLRSLARRRR